MDVVRQIYESLPETIRMPDSLENRPVEVILAPLKISLRVLSFFF